jgi:hypothetical protein
MKTLIAAVLAGLLFALLFTGLEILSEDPQATHSISPFHTPLIWLLASTFFYLVLHAVSAVRNGRVRERPIRFGLSVAGALVIGLFWLLPMLSGLMRCLGTGC